MPSLPVTAGYPGLLLSSTVVLGLMLYMSLRLYAGNRRAAYRTLIVSLGFIFVYQVLQLALALNWLPSSGGIHFAGKWLQASAFVVMNFAVFELYYRRRPRTKLWFYGLLAAAALIAAGELLGARSGDAGWAERLRDAPALDVYLLVLPLLFSLMFGPHIGQPRKYACMLAASFGSQLSAVLHAYWFRDSGAVAATGAVLQVVCYVLLFMILFERVVELLMTAYRSSITDGLTNLYNRRYFTSQLERALRSGKPVGVLFCDIDNFKRLNDTHGHHKADGVLKQAAAILVEETEGHGLAGRYGGEELVAFVAGPALTAEQAAETVRARIEKESLVTVSVGLCVAVPGDGTSAEELLNKADQAMYHSKTTGKNRVTDYAAISGASISGPNRAAAGLKR